MNVAQIRLAAPSGGVTKGTGYLIGSLFVVAKHAKAEGLLFTGKIKGRVKLPKTSAQAWTPGQRIYWDDSNHRCDSDGTVGPLIGIAEVAAANPSATGTVRLNGAPQSTSEGPQGAIADLVDNSGGAGGDGTIGAVTAPTALTDSGGGTADGTVALMTIPADITGGEAPTEAEHNAVLAQLRLMKDNFQELTTAQGQDRTAIVALTDAVKELSTKQNALLAALRTAGIIAAA